jgi:hypothetical protein
MCGVLFVAGVGHLAAQKSGKALDKTGFVDGVKQVDVNGGRV